MKCLQCSSERIVRNVRVVDRAHANMKSDLRIEVYENPDAVLFKGAHGEVLKANVCAECGFVMLSVSVSEARKLERFQNDTT